MFLSFKNFLFYLILLVFSIIRVAFVTLLEQKLLSNYQIRVGPNKVGYWGLLQPFADAVKLFVVEDFFVYRSFNVWYVISPCIILIFSLTLWILYPLFRGGLNFNFSLIFFVVITGLGVYPIYIIGWSSNCKYSLLGRLRAVAQIVSYEVNLIIVLLCIIWVRYRFNLIFFIGVCSYMYIFFCFSVLGYIWFVSRLAETNRTPYDFSEGESELVSGFNTEYSGGLFVIIFLAEYSNIIFMRLIFVILFLSGVQIEFVIFKILILSIFFIWVRGTLPRFRYDKLMFLTWKILLPVVLFIFFFSIYLNC